MDKNVIPPDAVAGITKPMAFDSNATRYGDKNAVAAMLGMSKRTVENLMAQGCPHLALGRRRTRFDLDEVRAWLREKFHTQRRGQLKGGAK